LGAFLAGLDFFPDFPFFGATGARCGVRLAFLAALGCSSVAVAEAAAFSSSVFARHLIFSLCGDHRGHDMDHSGASGKQVDSAGNRKRRWNGDHHGYCVQLAAVGI